MSSEVTTRTPARTPARTRTASSARILGVAALVGVVITLVVFAALHLLPPTSDISPVRRTISEYALTSSAWAFNLAVIVLALATAAVLAGLVALQRIRPFSGATIAGGAWIAGLLTLVSFPKHNWALGTVSNSGQIHRLASLVAFVALPIAVMICTRGRAVGAGRLAFWLAPAALAWFLPLLYAIVTAPRAWWQEIPLGLIERGLALTEVVAIAALALWVRRGAPIRPEPLPAG